MRAVRLYSSSTTSYSTPPKRMYISPRMEVASSEEMTMLAASLINAKNELGDDIDYAKENKNEWELE